MRRKALGISEVLQFWAKDFKLEKKQIQFEVDSIWRELFGEDIYAKTSKIEIKNKTVVIHINSPILKNELKFTQSKVLQKIQEKLGEDSIETIKIV